MGPNESMRGVKKFLLGAIALAVASFFPGCFEDGEQPTGYTDSLFYGEWESTYVHSEGEWQYIRPSNYSEFGATFRFYTNGICFCEGPLIGDLSGTFERAGNLVTIFDQGSVVCRLFFQKVIYDIATLTIEKDGLSTEIRMERTDNTECAYVPVEGIEFAATKVKMESKTTLRLDVEVLPKDATNKNIIWRSLDQKIVTVEDGVATAMTGRGRTTVEAITEEGGYSAKCEVEVGMELSMSVSELKMESGAARTLTCLYANDIPCIGKVKWTSTDPNVVAVQSDGDSDATVYGLNAGQTTVRALLEDGATAVCPVTIVPVTTLELTYRELREEDVWGVMHCVMADETPYYLPRWESTDESVLTVEGGSGLCDSARIRAHSPGMTSVFAYSHDGSRYAKYTVEIPELEVEDYVVFTREADLEYFEDHLLFTFRYDVKNTTPSFYGCRITPVEIKLITLENGGHDVVSLPENFQERELKSGEHLAGTFIPIKTEGTDLQEVANHQKLFYRFYLYYRDSRGEMHEMLLRINE